ncbi:MAG: site-specific DNA-methyltransferase [Bacteroidetes bacterium]|nr:MAG: site-specific DNA-methyltransferase [Bacteroidota bacterium]
MIFSLQEFSETLEDVETTYLTHAIHPYPAKFPPKIPRKILEKFSAPGKLVLDPFCGSGTTLVEARLLGVNSVGIDINGLACLLSKVKATPINEQQIQMIHNVIEKFKEISFKWNMGSRKNKVKFNFKGIGHWFQDNVCEELTLIQLEINEIKEKVVQDFFRISFSSIIVRVSNQDSDTRFAAINKNVEDGFTINYFLKKSKDYLKRLVDFSKLAKANCTVDVVNADTRNLNFLMSDSIDIIITSPPYANTYDYYLYHKFRKRWLGIDVEFAQYNEIGSRREFSSLKQEPTKWLEDLKICFSQMHRVLKKDSFAFIVIGDSVIKKQIIRMDEAIKGFSSQVGLVVEHVVSSDLSNHSKIFNPLFAQKGKKEHLIIMRKKS